MSVYTTREKFKAAVEVKGDNKNSAIDRHIEAASRKIDKELGRFFYPKLQTRYFDWPPKDAPRQSLGWEVDETYYITSIRGRQVLTLDEDFLTLSANGVTAKNGTVTIADADIYLEPVNEGKPYKRLEINAATSNANSVFQSSTTPQRAIAVTGYWGYSDETETAGTISGISSGTTDTSGVVSNASLVEVGDTLLIESEQLQVTDRAFAALGAILLNGALTNQLAARTVVVDAGHGILTGEVILVDSERMYVESVATNTLTVIKSYDGSTLAAHNDDTAVSINRAVTLVRGVNGTTAAAHADGTTVMKYKTPGPISALCLSEAIFNFEQDEAGQTGVVGSGEGSSGVTAKSLMKQWEDVKCGYMRPLSRVGF